MYARGAAEQASLARLELRRDAANKSRGADREADGYDGSRSKRSSRSGPRPSRRPAPRIRAAGWRAPAGDASGNWGQQGQTPDWAQKAQQWRPADVAAGPASGIVYADLTNRIIAYIIDLVILVIVGFVVNLVLLTAFIATLVSTEARSSCCSAWSCSSSTSCWPRSTSSTRGPR